MLKPVPGGAWGGWRVPPDSLEHAWDENAAEQVSLDACNATAPGWGLARQQMQLVDAANLRCDCHSAGTPVHAFVDA